MRFHVRLLTLFLVLMCDCTCKKNFEARVTESGLANWQSCEQFRLPPPPRLITIFDTIQMGEDFRNTMKSKFRDCHFESFEQWEQFSARMQVAQAEIELKHLLAANAAQLEHDVAARELQKEAALFEANRSTVALSIPPNIKRGIKMTHALMNEPQFDAISAVQKETAHTQLEATLRRLEVLISSQPPFDSDELALMSRRLTRR